MAGTSSSHASTIPQQDDHDAAPWPQWQPHGAGQGPKYPAACDATERAGAAADPLKPDDFAIALNL